MRRYFATDLVAFYLLTACLVIVPLLTNDAHLLHLCGLCGIYFILLAGFNLCAGTAGQISFGHGALFALGGYTTALLVMKGGVPWIPSALIAICVALTGGVILAATGYGIKAFYLGLSTTACGWILYKVLWAWISFTGGEPGLPVKVASIWGFELWETRIIYPIAGFALFSLVVCRNIMFSRVGRALKAISANEIIAQAVGVNVDRYKFMIFVLSAFFAGIAGIFYAYFTMFVDPSLSSLDTSFSFVIILVIGGWATVFGPILGAVLFIVLPAYFSFLQEHWALIWSLLLIVILLLSPKGLWGIFSDFLNRFSSLRRPAEKKSSPPEIQNIPNDLSFLRKSEPCLLSLRNVSKSFGGLKAIENVSIDIEKGRIHALIGPNGSGKTTLVNLMTGFYKCDSGEINFNGTRIDTLSPHQIVNLGISRTFQGALVCEGMNLIDNISIGQFPRTKAGVFSCAFAPPTACREERGITERSRRLISLVDLARFVNTDAESLGDAQRRWLEILRALANNPKILILDEPVSGLIYEEVKGVMENLQRLRDEGIAILLIEHHMEAVMAISDVITVLNFGNKIAEGTPEEIRNNEAVLTAYLGKKRIW